MSHPAYPSSADLARERDATNRDLTDRLRISVLDTILRRAIREIEAVSEIQHPNARYSVGELAEVLHAELNNIEGVADVLCGQLVLEDE